MKKSIFTFLSLLFLSIGFAQNNALKFNTVTNFATIGGNELLPPWTVEMWVYKNRSKASSTLVDGVTGKINFETLNTSSAVGLSIKKVGDYGFPSGYAVPWTTWTHLAFVCNGTKTYLYVNGLMKDSLNKLINLPMTSLGNNIESPSASIDEVRFWKVALTKSEIFANMNKSVANNNTNIIFYLNADNQLNPATDISTSVKTCSLTGMSYIANTNAAFITKLPIPYADFSVSATAVATGNSINFSDQSKLSPTTLTWNFPAGIPATTNIQNPVVTYPTAGIYNATVTATTSGGSTTKTVVVKVGQKPIANFKADIYTINKNSKVQFTDLSSNEPNSWLWTFQGGEPAISTERNPIVTYPEAGSHNVSLTSTNVSGQNLITKNALINVSNSQGGKFYVSLTGDDLNSGTETDPLRTIAKAASIIRGGDTCIIKGGNYREEVIPTNSGSIDNPIVFTRYGADTVVVNGTDVIGNWQLYKDNIYKTYVTKKVYQVLVNGKQANIGTYPNINNFAYEQTNWSAIIVASTGIVSFTAANFTANQWKGGTFLGIAGKKWVMLSGSINSNNATSVNCTYPSAQAGQLENVVYNGAGVGYITNHINTLDAPYEWHWQNDTLYMSMPSQVSPNSQFIEARTRINGFTGDNKSNIVLKDINFLASSISFKTSQNCIVDGGTVRYPSPFFVHTINWARSSLLSDSWEGKGVYCSGTNNKFKNLVVSNSFGDGISMGGSSNTVSNCLIDSCDFAGLDMAPVSVIGPNQTIQNSSISKSGRSGLLHRYAKKCTIKNNDIGYVGLNTEDLGVTYTYQTNGEGAEIAYNLIHDNKATPYGMGIYLDNADTSFVVHHNVVWNCTNAIHMNYPAVNHQVYNNTVWDCTYAITSGSGMGFYTNIVVKNNLSNRTWLSVYDIESNNLTTSNPGFVNVVARDFSLLASSPAINFGISVPSYTDGFTGTTPDAGAFEYDAVKWVAGATGIKKMNFKIARPVASFTANTKSIPVGSQVVFSDQSSENPISWLWTFEGGTPQSSTSKNPTVIYNSSGKFAVSLTVGTQLNLSSTITKSAYIEVGVSALKDIELSNSVKLFPNPNNGEFSVELNDIGVSYEVQVITLTGVIIAQKSINKKHFGSANKIQFNGIPRGMYMLKIDDTSNNRTTGLKLIVN